MLSIKTWTLPCILLGAALAAQADSKFGINAFSNNLNVFDATSAKGQFKLAPQIGLRYYATKYIGVDFSLGGALEDAVSADSARKQAGDPGARIFNGELGLFAKLVDLEGAYFGLNTSVGLSSQRWADFDNHFRPAPLFPSYATYNVIIPYFFLGVEPGYFFNSHFSLFSRFGINLAYFPTTKYINFADPSYDSAAQHFPLASRHDDNSSLSIATAGLGARFVF